jgi:beta-lactamase class A
MTVPQLVVVDPATAAAQQALATRIETLGRSFHGDVGIAVKDLQNGWTGDYDGSTHFPQQSVSKFWVALTTLDKADRGELSLTAPVVMRGSDITLFHQPIAAEIRKNGTITTTIGALMERALQQSDNTCNDFVLWQAGGPDAVRAFLVRKGIDGIRFGPGERLLQTQIAGLSTWKDSYAGRGFEAARNQLPLATRKAAFERYIADPIDGATPLGVVDALGRLNNGELLSPQSTSRLLGIMSHTKTGAQRLKGGLSAGWSVAHKTGTGQVFGGEQAGYNDIGILTGPDSRSYSVAVLMRRTSAPLGERMGLMQNVVRAVIDYSGRTGGQTLAAVAPAGRITGSN